MNTQKRVILIVLDGFGAGETTDAANFNDTGAYTSRHILEAYPRINAPFMLSHGLLGYEHSDILIPEHPNKDTLSGLYELMGLVYPKLPTFPKGFPLDDIATIENLISKKIIGNYPCSGTDILHTLGEEHLHSQHLIVYTSSDSVFQIAAHQEMISVSLLYYYCTIIREYFNQKLPVGRVIARPFLGSKASDFYRTVYRKDFPFIPDKLHVLHRLIDLNITLAGNHVINQLFPGLLHQTIEGKCDISNLNSLIAELQLPAKNAAFYFVDLEDLDMHYGHRRDIKGYAEALEKIDQKLIRITELMSSEDLLIISADHGNDPAFSGHTDHTRENVPYLIMDGSGKNYAQGPVKGMHWIADKILEFFSKI
jgi:phosphopentomutase